MFFKEQRIIFRGGGEPLLILGVDKGGYGEGFLDEAVSRTNDGGQKQYDVFVTSSNPTEEKKALVESKGAILIPHALNFDVTRKAETAEEMKKVIAYFKDQGVTDLSALVNFVAGGYPDPKKDPNFLAYARGAQEFRYEFNDLPKYMMENVAYVMAQCHADVIQWLADANLLDNAKVISTSYREPMPGYTIADLKRRLEQHMEEYGKQGIDTMGAAIPRMPTISGRMFTDIFWTSTGDYAQQLHHKDRLKDPRLNILFQAIKAEFNADESCGEMFKIIIDFMNLYSVDYALDRLIVDPNLTKNSSPIAKYPQLVRELMDELVAQLGSFAIGKTDSLLQRTSYRIADLTRLGTAHILLHEIKNRQCTPGTTQRINHGTFAEFDPSVKETGASSMQTIDTSADINTVSLFKETPHKLNDAAIRELMGEKVGMYGPSMRLLHTAEFSEDKSFARATFTVPQPSSKSIEPGGVAYMRDHFWNTPLMPGVLQEEVGNQLAVLLELQKDATLLPLLTEIENFKLETMVLPGDLLDVEVEILESGKRERRFRIKIECKGKTSVGFVRAQMIKKELFLKNYEKAKTVSEALQLARAEQGAAEKASVEA